MKIDFNINEYADSKFAMHCRTENEASIFCAYLNSLGKTWRGGGSYIDNNRYSMHGNQTAYAFNQGLFGSVRGCEESGYTVLNFCDYNFSHKSIKIKDINKDDFLKIISC